MRLSDEVQHFSSTSGRVLGTIAVATSVGVVVATLLARQDAPSYEVLALAVVFGALAWVTLLRPRLELDRSRLVMRGMLSTVTLPLAAIESVSVRQVLVVFAGDKRYTSAAVGRSRRQLVRDGKPATGASSGGILGTMPAMTSTRSGHEGSHSAGSSYELFVEERIRSRVSDVLAQEGVKARSAEQARFAQEIDRRPAIAEIVVLAGSVALSLALVLT